MKQRRLLVVVVTIVITLTLTSQAASADEGGSIGLGIHTGGGFVESSEAGLLGLGGLGGLGGVSSTNGGAIAVPIVIHDSIRLTPTIAGSLTERESVGDSTTRSSTTSLSIGLTGAWVGELTKSSVWYAGPRLALGFAENEFQSLGNTMTTRRTTPLVAAVAGAEYFLTPMLSIGAEVSLNARFLGDTTTESDGVEVDTPEESGTSLNTATALTFNWYLL